MSEEKEGCAWLEDVEEHTFVRFSQYAYTGDYVAADPEILLDPSMIANTQFTSNGVSSDTASEIGEILSVGTAEVLASPVPGSNSPEPVPVALEPAVERGDWGGFRSKRTKRKRRRYFGRARRN